MQITVYNMQGSAGKTPTATNIALDKKYTPATNELYNLLGAILLEKKVFSAARCKVLGLNPFADLSINAESDCDSIVSNASFECLGVVSGYILLFQIMEKIASF